MAIEPLALEGRLVEIHGLDGPAEVRDRRLNLVGEAVGANGTRGLAAWDAGSGEYAVATLDGLVLRIPGGNLQECDSLGPEEEEDGCDLIWPAVCMARVGATFGAQVAELLQAKGYCQIRMPQDVAARQAMLEFAAEDWDAYTVPRAACEEACLGQGASSKVMWLSDAELPEELPDGPMQHYNQHLMDVSYNLFPLMGEFLGFEPSEHRGKTLLRVPLAGEAERQRLEEGPLDEGAIESGLLEAHLDFVQRRRLCMMYLIGGEGGSLHLQSRESPEEAVTLPVAGGRLVLFRHDALSYSYAPGGARDLVLQSWLLERPPVFRLDGFDGDLASAEAIFGGPAQSPDQQVHVMCGMCRFPGGAHGLEGAWAVYSGQTDAFREVPSYRWDYTLYYAETDAQFGAGGKSSSKHCGFLHDEELESFDNELFGIDSRVAKLIVPIQRVCLEVTFEMLVLAGFSRASLQGAPIMCCVGDCGLEWHVLEGLSDDPHAWLRAAVTGPAATPNRLCHILGLTGPAVAMDTACSSTMVAAQMCHGALRKHTHKGVDRAFFTGVNFISNPFSFIGLSAAGMLGRGGRCKTFDDSANGFNRGEGSGGAFLKVRDDAQSALDRIGSLVATYTNQDGRSASLTAPNGPSQQACIRGSWRQGGLAQSDLSTTENHGTGTALGDPIECGTVRSVFRGHAGLPVTSGKTHMGHLESTAGSVGFLKVILSLNHAAVPANCHLRRLNAHIEFDRHFAGVCLTELCDLPYEHSHAGANSYGFGGTNSRADLWARRLHRVRDTSGQFVPGQAPMARLAANSVDFMAVTCARCSGPMCWLCGAATPEVGRRVGRHRCTDVRAVESAPTCCDRCYDGDYLYRHGAPGAIASSGSTGARIHLVGTWNAWTEPTEMARAPGLGDVYEGEVVLSDIRFELFHLVVRHGDGSEMVIHPAAKRAGPRVRVAGPHKHGQGKHWLIDGLRDGAPAGTVYRVRFEWGDFWKSVSWEALTDRPLVPEEDRFRHVYCIASSLTGWAPLRGGHTSLDLPNLYDPDDERSWHWSRGTLPASGAVELLFLRDYDQSQMIYPMQRLPSDESVPVAGPDEFGTGKRWLAHGTEGERLYASISVEEGVITVKISTATMGDLAWRSPRRGACLAYYAVGSWDSWALTEMESDGGCPDVYRCRFVVGRAGRERFKVVANQNWGMQLYPSQSDGYPGTCLVSGPDGRGHDSNWLVEGTPGQRMEVVLDLDAEDHRGMVTCVCVDDVD